MSNKDTITQLKDILCFYEDAARLKTPITVQDSEVQTIKEAVSALEANEWQPIATAPKDKCQMILGYGMHDDGHHLYGVIYWHVSERSGRGRWLGGHFTSHGPVTYWKPLPQPPEDQGS